MSESCLECLACCHGLVVRVQLTDVQREPKILAEAAHEPEKRSWRLVPRELKPGRFNYTCPFLRGWGCSIYATRPDVCRRFTRGSPECRLARKRAGKEPIDD